MTKQEILDAIHGKMIISCQAIPGEPLYLEDDSVMYLRHPMYRLLFFRCIMM